MRSRKAFILGRVDARVFDDEAAAVVQRSCHSFAGFGVVSLINEGADVYYWNEGFRHRSESCSFVARLVARVFQGLLGRFRAVLPCGDRTCGGGRGWARRCGALGCGIDAANTGPFSSAVFDGNSFVKVQ